MVFAIIMSIINLKLYYVCTSLQKNNRYLIACFVLQITLTQKKNEVRLTRNVNPKKKHKELIPGPNISARNGH